MMELIQSITIALLGAGLILNGLAVARLRRTVEALTLSHKATLEALDSFLRVASLGEVPTQPEDDPPASTRLH
jgi:hypothetical protein